MLIPALDLLLPQHVSTEALLSERMLHEPWVCKLSASEAVEDYTMVGALEDILGEISPTETLALNPEAQTEDLAHDEYFRIRRVDSACRKVFVRGILSARLFFLQEAARAPVTIAHEDLSLIDEGFADLLVCLSGGSLSRAARVTQWTSHGVKLQVKERWVCGHQVFAALTQGLIFAFGSLGRALRAGRGEDVRHWAELCVTLLNASGAAFIFTGDFPPEEYEKTIRPSMTPPNCRVALSGLMSADHRYLAQMMRDMRPALRALAEQEPERHGRISAALNNVYERHIHVCERFVGERPSILTAGRTERSGPSLIGQFKTLRLKPFEHSERAPRLVGRETVALGECPYKK